MTSLYNDLHGDCNWLFVGFEFFSPQIVTNHSHFTNKFNLGRCMLLIVLSCTISAKPHKSNLQRLKSPHIYKVVDAMAHAVTSTRPKLRYVVGWDGVLWRTLSFLPSEIQDKVLGLIL